MSERTTDADLWDDPGNSNNNTEMVGIKGATDQPISHNKVKSVSLDKQKKYGTDFRDEYDDSGPNSPSYIHPCIWGWIIWIVLSYIGLFILNNEGIMVSGAGMGIAGIHYASFGWKDYKIYRFKSKSTIDEIQVLKKNDYLFLYTKRILTDITLLFLVTLVITITFVLIISLILCIRCQSKKNYSLSIFNKLFIPQRPVIMILFDSISILTWGITFMFIVLTFYSLMEILVYAGLFCFSSQEECYVFPSPHGGIIVLFVLDLIWGCFIMQRVANLDYKLESKSIFAYFPKLGTAAVDDSSPIFLGELTAVISCARKLIVLYIWSWCLQNSGLLSIWYIADNGSITSNNNGQNNGIDSSSLIFWGMPHGISNKERYTTENAELWVLIGSLFNYLYPTMILFSIIILIYCSITIHKYIYVKSIRLICIILGVLQILIYITLISLYYVFFSQYWNDDGKYYVSRSPIIETPIKTLPFSSTTCGGVLLNNIIDLSINTTTVTLYDTNIDFGLRCDGPWWSPDWSVFLVIVILFYQIRMIWKLIRFPRPKPPGT